MSPYYYVLIGVIVTAACVYGYYRYTRKSS